jgi:hypothetical protein
MKCKDIGAITLSGNWVDETRNGHYCHGYYACRWRFITCMNHVSQTWRHECFLADMILKAYWEVGLDCQSSGSTGMQNRNRMTWNTDRAILILEMVNAISGVKLKKIIIILVGVNSGRYWIWKKSINLKRWIYEMCWSLMLLEQV